MGATEWSVKKTSQITYQEPAIGRTGDMMTHSN